MIHALHILKLQERATLRECDPGHEGDQIDGGVVLLGEAVEALDHHLGVFDGCTKIGQGI
jgi:hypothetical protein